MADIIRCKDCKYLREWRTPEQAEKFGQIYECEMDFLTCPSPDDYCSKAEKKEQKFGKWIPFSERLPKPFEHCLITTKDGEVIYHYDDGHYSKYKAWMPLPEPYKTESEEE